VLSAVGIPDRFVGAVRLDEGETAQILTLGFVYSAFGSCVSDDLFIIPDHGGPILYTSHHEVIHANFGEHAQIKSFVDCMAAAGFLLPTEPPDETFRWPSWMDEKGAP
jgi:hypothetical protein